VSRIPVLLGRAVAVGPPPGDEPLPERNGSLIDLTGNRFHDADRFLVDAGGYRQRRGQVYDDAGLRDEARERAIGRSALYAARRAEAITIAKERTFQGRWV